MNENWHHRCYRRNLLDMHIADWDPRFLSAADPAKISETFSLDGSCAIHVFANSHTGLTYFPSRLGRMHAGLQGRDLFGGLVDAYHRMGKAVIAYYSVVYNQWFWEQYPDSRVVDAEGRSEKLLVGIPLPTPRSSVCCPNSKEYREFTVTQLAELCEGYDFEGFYPDNCFWPTVCYCTSCRKRYAEEIGGELPRTINWEDPVWVRFQRKRQEWIADFAFLLSNTARKSKPGITVSHQANIWNGDWLLGPSLAMVGATDWLAADASGDRAELSYVAKLFWSLSVKKPFEMIHSWHHRGIMQNTVAWTEDRMRCAAFAAFVHGGARTFIDAIDPAGTLNREPHVTAGRVFAELAPFERFGGGESLEDVGIYVSFDSFVSLSENGRPVSDMRYNFDPTRPPPELETHRTAAIGMARALLQEHLPFGIVTAADLGRLDRWQAIVLPNIVMMNQEEADALKEYVRRGGGLYASKNTSIISANGVRQTDFMLSDVFGVSYRGETAEVVTYAAPCDAAAGLFRPFSAAHPVTTFSSMALVEALPGAEVLATITLPYTDPRGERFASIFCNPPGNPTDRPALVQSRFGQGRAVYAAGVFELWDYETQRRLLCDIVRLLLRHPPVFSAQAPIPVEITAFHQPEQGRIVLHVFNFQQELPNIPVEGIRLQIRMEGRRAARVVTIPEEKSVDFSLHGDTVSIVLPKLETYLMVVVEYQ